MHPEESHPHPWRLLRRAQWRGRVQGAAAVLFLVFFTRWALLALGIVLFVVGIARLFGWQRRFGRRRRHLDAADLASPLDLERDRQQEHERALADFNARLERAVEDLGAETDVRAPAALLR